MKKPPFVNNEIYHIYNRGVEKRNVFLDNMDHFRFINCLVEFNDINPALPTNIRYLLRHPSKATAHCLEVQLLNNGDRLRESLIEILAFCLMPNHYHLLIRQLTDGGISKFMQKLGTGYTNYFNLKNERVGSLFQGRFKAVLVEKEEHFRYLPLYIHLNPLDLVAPEWRDGEISNKVKTLGFLENYRWSSYLDYKGTDNFPSVITKDFLLDVFGGTNGLKNYTEDFMKTLELESIKDVILD
ncbi:MAG: transposase [Candidatus Taylorbacteria bacterium]|nr:transposase [Candidatus Taylorbacteria bacterium]